MKKELRNLLCSGDWEKIGEVGVDSGQLLIVDPCYLLGKRIPTLRNHIFKTLEENRYGTIPELHDLGTAFFSGYGDGLYSVYGQIENGRVMRVLVEMDYIDRGEDEE